MSERPPAWDKYEAALLLEGLIDIILHNMPRSEVIRRVSDDLRDMAKNRGIEINELYRNVNGITFQIQSMESAYYGYTIFKPATKLFIEVVDIYRNKYLEFEKLLKEAKQMVIGNELEKSCFMEYLTTKVSSSQLSKIWKCYAEISDFCIKIKVLKKPLLETTDIEVIKEVQRTIEQNKIFRFTHKKNIKKIALAGKYYFAYIKESEFLPKNVLSVEQIATVEDICFTENKRDNNMMVRTAQDSRLLQKYPIVYRRVFSVFKELSQKNTSSISVNEIEKQIGQIACSAIIEEILDNASWSITVGENYLFSKKLIERNFGDDAEIKSKEVSLIDSTAEAEDKKISKNGTKKESFISSIDTEHIVCTERPSEVNSVTFSNYMKDELNLADTSCRSYASAINNCEAFAKQHGFASWQLYTGDKETVAKTVDLLLKDEEFLTYNARQRNRLRLALRKFLTYVSIDSAFEVRSITEIQPEISYKKEEYSSVLRENFKKGFRIGSSLEIRKFKRYYSVLNGIELSDSDELITQHIKEMCVVYEGKAFLPEIMLSEELKDALLQYIDESFARGKKAIYFQALFNEFSEKFLNYPIQDADMLRRYIIQLKLENIFVNQNYISRDPNMEIDPISEVRSCLQKFARPMEYGELFSSLPHLPQNKIKSILASNGEFVNNGHGVYFHESMIALSDKELENIAAIIECSIEEKKFIGGNELYNAIKSKYPYIIENNSMYSMYGFRDALKYKFGNRFSFKGNIISHAGQELSMSDVFADYSRQHDSFTLTELQLLAEELATVIYFEPVYKNCLRISKDQFVSKNQAQFMISDTDAAIDQFCAENYIPIKKITNFATFPYTGFPWNSFLLEHYVAEYSHKYKLLHSNYNENECAGAIVKRSAKIDTFDEFIVDLLANSNIELNKISALQYLSDMGYLVRRRYSNIEVLIIKAKAQRNRKDTN
ncbi:MAG: hypothetical protein PUJ52_09455 [Firmicutes bacterium]|nr:hypothetical protein [Bacillota bacterium]